MGVANSIDDDDVLCCCCHLYRWVGGGGVREAWMWRERIADAESLEEHLEITGGLCRGQEVGVDAWMTPLSALIRVCKFLRGSKQLMKVHWPLSLLAMMLLLWWKMDHMDHPATPQTHRN